MVSRVSTFEEPKIVFPDIAKEARFAFDDNGFYVNDTGFAIPVKDLYLLGVLNSTAAWEYISRTAAVLGDPDRRGRLRLKRAYMEKLPIPNAPATERAVISRLVEKCLDAKGVGCEKWEKEINERVAALYGL